jgi:hypothetical protein
MNEVPIERLKEVLELRPGGIVAWRQKPLRGRVREDLIAGGSLVDGYLRLTVDFVELRQHRVVWALHYGRWPAGPIDHIDGDRTNNDPSNLRLATISGNNRNSSRNRRNTTGYRGVYWDKRTSKWKSMIYSNGKSTFLGYFNAAREAAEAYVLASLELHGEFSPFNRPC